MNALAIGEAIGTVCSTRFLAVVSLHSVSFPYEMGAVLETTRPEVHENNASVQKSGSIRLYINVTTLCDPYHVKKSVLCHFLVNF
jgi:hypothetical protein